MRTAYELQALTRASPATSAPAAEACLLLSDLIGHRLVVEAPAGCALAGTGAMLAWVRHYATGAWLRAPHLDVALESVGARGVVFPDVLQTVKSAESLFYAAESVTLAGTATDPGEADKVKVYLYGEPHR